MKISFLLFFLLFCFQNTFSQLAVVVDKDGYVNVRDKDKRIVDKLSSGEVVYRFGDIDGWESVDYIKDGENHWGYIHKSRLFNLSCFDKIPLISDSEDKAILKKDSIVITLIEKDFIPSQNKISRKDGFVNKINGKQFWGMDGGMPTREYKSITVSMCKRSIDIPPMAFNNLYEPNLFSTEANYDKDNDILYLHSMNSDGAGGYIVVWVIEKGQYKGRYVYHGF